MSESIVLQDVVSTDSKISSGNKFGFINIDLDDNFIEDSENQEYIYQIIEEQNNEPNSSEIQLIDGDIRIQFQNTTLFCEICYQIYSDSISLEEHIQTDHILNIEEEEEEQGTSEKDIEETTANKERPKMKKVYSCSQCDRTFTRLSNLCTHKRIHSGEKPFTCHVCNKSFRHSSSLRKHERIHSGEKPYSCKLCNERFSRLNGLRKHEQSHIS